MCHGLFLKEYKMVICSRKTQHKMTKNFFVVKKLNFQAIKTIPHFTLNSQEITSSKNLLYMLECSEVYLSQQNPHLEQNVANPKACVCVDNARTQSLFLLTHFTQSMSQDCLI